MWVVAGPFRGQPLSRLSAICVEGLYAQNYKAPILHMARNGNCGFIFFGGRGNGRVLGGEWCFGGLNILPVDLVVLEKGMARQAERSGSINTRVAHC